MAKVLRWPEGLKEETPKERGARGLLMKVFNIQRQQVSEKGVTGEWKVARELADSLSDKWVVINDLKIKTSDGKTQIDHLVFGPTGVFCLETKNWNTAACNEQGQWFRYQNNLWVPQRSPVEQQLTKIRYLTNKFQHLQMGVRVQGIIVFASPGKFEFSQAKLSESIMVMGLPGLIHYLQQHEKEVPDFSKEELGTLIAAVGY